MKLVSSNAKLKMWFGGDSAKIKIKKSPTIRGDFAKFKMKNQQITEGDSVEIKIDKFSFPKQKLYPNF